MQILHGYNIDEKQWKAGNDGQYNIATKDGKKYLMKRLSFPRYPVSDNFKGEFKQKKVELCNEWLRCRQDIINAIPGFGMGTIVKPIELFREGPCYYEVSNMIESTCIPYYEIYKEPKEYRTRIMMIVALSLSGLHKKGIVHGNLNSDNILVYQLPGSRNPVVKLIGFENSFFENKPPEVISSDSVWQSPEVIRYNQAALGEIVPNPFENDISCKLDVYSVGLIFHLYCSGTLPIYGEKPSEQEASVENALQISQKIESDYRILITNMLQEDPSKRLSMSDVHQFLLGKRRSVWPKSKWSDLQLGQKEKKTFVSENTPIELVAGNGVKRAYIHPRNSRKVVLTFENGKEQIVDKNLAMKMGYVKKEEIL